MEIMPAISPAQETVAFDTICQYLTKELGSPLSSEPGTKFSYLSKTASDLCVVFERKLHKSKNPPIFVLSVIPADSKSALWTNIVFDKSDTHDPDFNGGKVACAILPFNEVTSLEILKSVDELNSSATFAKLKKFIFYVVHEWPSIIRQVCNDLSYKSTLSFKTSSSFYMSSNPMKYSVRIDSVDTGAFTSLFSSERTIIVFQGGESDGQVTITATNKKADNLGSKKILIGALSTEFNNFLTKATLKSCFYDQIEACVDRLLKIYIDEKKNKC